MKCNKCKSEISEAEKAAYRCLCEDCYADSCKLMGQVDQARAKVIGYEKSRANFIDKPES